MFFISALNKKFLSRLPDNNDDELIRKILLLNSISLIGIIFLFIFCVVAIVQGSYGLAIIDLLAALFLIGMLIIMYVTSNYIACCYFGVTVMFSHFIYSFVTGGIGGTAFMWHYTFPLVSLFLLGAKSGAIASILLFIPSSMFLFYDLFSDQLNIYDMNFALRFIPSYLIVFTFSYIYEKSRANSQYMLKKAIENREHIIETRTEQLKKEIEIREEYSNKLRQSQKMEAIGLMASGVAHDLNNILSGITSYPELVLHQMSPDNEFREPLEKILDSGKRSALVVADLLTVARGVASIKIACSLNEIITGYMQSIEFKTLESHYPNITYVKNIDPELHKIQCSPTHIQKAVMNIILNASEAIDDTGTVTITTWNILLDESSASNLHLETGSYAAFSVEDTGEGMTEVEMEHIFDPFYTKKIMQRSGTGLGLAITWNTVQDHDGGIFVESSGKGSKFYLYFPATFQELSPAKKTVSTEDVKGHGEKILIIDDEPLQLEVTSEIINVLGYSYECASSGEIAVEYLKNNSVDLVLIDMMMGPGMNGRETYEEIIKIHPDQAAIIVSGLSNNIDVAEALKLGVKGFVSKPYTIAEIGKMIQDSLK